jgi:uncharacterized Zn finger protein
MECNSCGYVHIFDFDKDKWVGDKDFIFINRIVVENINGERPQNIYACPECGTLKLDI